MKKPILLVAILGLSFLIFPAIPLAQQRNGQTAAQPPSGTKVVVVDVVHILKNFKQYHKARADITTDIKAYEQVYRQRRSAIQKKIEQVKEFKVGSRQVRKLHAEITRMQSDLKVDATLERNNYREKEARLLFDYYRAIEQQIHRLSEKHQIDLVLNFDRRRIDENSPAQDIWRGVNRRVVFQSKLDITGIVLQLLNRGYAPKQIKKPFVPRRRDQRK